MSNSTLCELDSAEVELKTTLEILRVISLNLTELLEEAKEEEQGYYWARTHSEATQFARVIFDYVVKLEKCDKCIDQLTTELYNERRQSSDAKDQQIMELISQLSATEKKAAYGAIKELAKS